MIFGKINKLSRIAFCNDFRESFILKKKEKEKAKRITEATVQR